MEIWKSIKDYEDYEVSNFGNVKSLKFSKERILKPGTDYGGYLTVVLCKESKLKTFIIHKLVATAFLEHTPCGHKMVVDHIDNNRLNNCLNNLQLISQRKNTSKDREGYSSKYVGVSWSKNNKKWRAEISVDGKSKYLGYFIDELEAHKTYKIALNNI
tara:strand:- start:119 stop:592 length:474 start_codon:yes stop_codon:yes gene_type:complete